MTFKIQKFKEEMAMVLKLSGRIQKENVEDLRQLCEPREVNSDLVLDLEEVQLVDRDVVRFLERCEGRGVHLRNCPAYVRDWIAQEHEQKG
jgi:anti-anti-sigma regulatory factor